MTIAPSYPNKLTTNLIEQFTICQVASLFRKFRNICTLRNYSTHMHQPSLHLIIPACPYAVDTSQMTWQNKPSLTLGMETNIVATYCTIFSLTLFLFSKSEVETAV